MYKFNFGVGKSLFQESEWLKAYKKDEKQKKAYDDQQAKFNSVVRETVTVISAKINSLNPAEAAVME